MRHPSRGSPRGLRTSPPRAREARVSPGPHEAGLVGPPDRGSTPHGGSNGADGRGPPTKPAWWGAPGPIPRQIDRGVVIAPVARPTAVTPPVLGPPEVLDQAAAMAGPRAGKAPVGLHHLRAVPGGLVTKLPAASSPSPTIRPWGVASRVVSRGIPWRRRAARWAWSRARRRPLRRQRFEPHRLRERDRERRRSTVRFRASGAGLGTRSITPSAVAMVANQRPPTSTPTLEAGSGWPGLGAPHEAGLGTPSERAPMGNPRGPPLRAIVRERGHRPGPPMGGGTPAVVPGTEAAQELAYVSDQVLVDLGGIDPHQPPSLGGERSLHLLGPEPRQAVPRLDHDRGHGRVTPQGQEPPTRSVQRRANLGHAGAFPGIR